MVSFDAEDSSPRVDPESAIGVWFELVCVKDVIFSSCVVTFAEFEVNGVVESIKDSSIVGSTSVEFNGITDTE